MSYRSGMLKFSLDGLRKFLDSNIKSDLVISDSNRF
jgi:hypothetical protein